MKKSIGFISMIFLLTLTLIIIPVFFLKTEAAAADKVYVNGYELKNGYYLNPSSTKWTASTTKPSGNSYVVYRDGTLTLYNVTYTTANGVNGIKSDGDLVVNVSGTNSITIKGTGAYGISAAGTLQFIGSGTLSVNTTTSVGIKSDGIMRFNQTGSITVSTQSSSCVMCYGSDLYVTGKLTVNADNGYGVYGMNNVSVNSGTLTVNASTSGNTYDGIIARDGDFSVSAGTVTVNSYSGGIRAGGNVTLAGTVTVTSSDKSGIYSSGTYKSVTLNSGRLIVTAKENGIRAFKFVINGGYSQIKSTTTGTNDSNFSAVRVDGTSSIFFVLNGNVHAKGANTSTGTVSEITNLANLHGYDRVITSAMVYVYGIEVWDGEYLGSSHTSTSTTKPSTGGYVYFKDGELVMNTFIRSSTTTHGIEAKGDLTIRLVNTSTSYLTLTSNKGSTQYYGINVGGNLSIYGDGTLYITNGNRAINAKGNLSVTDSSVIAEGAVIYAGGNMTLYSATVLSRQKSFSGTTVDYAIYTYRYLTVQNSDVTVNSPGDYLNTGIYAENGASISGSTVNVDVTNDGITATNGDIILNNSNVRIVSDDTGIYNVNCSVRIYSGSVEISAGGDGIDASSIAVGSVNYFDVKTEDSTAFDSYAVRVDDFSKNFTWPENVAATSYNYMSNTKEIIPSILTELDRLALRIVIGDHVIMHDEVVRTGYYMPSGNNSVSTTKRPTSGGYAYYHDGQLELNNYTYNATNTKYAILCTDDLEIKLIGNSTVRQIDLDGYITVKSSSGGVLDVTDISSNIYSNAIEIYGDMRIESGTVNVNSINGEGITGNNIEIVGGTLNVDTENYGMYFEQIDITGGTVNVYSEFGNGIRGEIIKISGGNITVDAYHNGITADQLDVTGGMLHAMSRYTPINDAQAGRYPDANDSALKVEQINIDGMNYLTAEEVNIDPYSPDALDKYDNVIIGKFVRICGVLVSPGQYLNKGSSIPSNTRNGDSYIHVQTLDDVVVSNYSYTGARAVIATGRKLNLKLLGENSFNVKHTSTVDEPVIAVGGNLGISTSGNRTNSLDIVVESDKTYRGIECLGDFTMDKGALTVETNGSYAISANNFTLNGGTVDLKVSYEVRQMPAATLKVAGNLVVTNGLLNVYFNGSYDNANCILVDGNFNMYGGSVIAETGMYGSGIAVQKNLTLNGGEITANGDKCGIMITEGRFYAISGLLTASCANVSDKDQDCALKLKENTTDNYNVATSISAAASKNRTKTNLQKLVLGNLASYSYVQIGQFIEIGGVTVKSGYSINGSGNLVYGIGGSGYASYKCGNNGNVLNLNGYNYNGTSKSVRGIDAYSDLIINVTTSNSSIVTGNYRGINVNGNLTFTGLDTRKLTVSASDSWPVLCTGEIIVDGPYLEINSDNYYGIDTNILTVNSGILKVVAARYGVTAYDKIVINGGTVDINSLYPEKLTSEQYWALNTDNVIFADGMNGFATSYTIWTVSPVTYATEIYDPENNDGYCRFYVGDAVCVSNRLLPSGYYLINSVDVVSSTSASKYTYYKNGKLTIKDCDVGGIVSVSDLEIVLDLLTVDQVYANSIHVLGDLTFSGNGYLYVKDYNFGIKAGGDVTVGKDVDVYSKQSSDDLSKDDTSAVECQNLTVYGKLSASSEYAENGAVNAKSVLVDGGEIFASAKTYAIVADRIELLSDATLNAYSEENGAKDAEYRALKTDTFICEAGENYVACANEDANYNGAKPFEKSKLNSYDFVQFEPLEIQVFDMEIPDGYYLNYGDTAFSATQTSSSNIHRTGNKIYVFNFDMSSYSALPNWVIKSNGDFEIILSGVNKLQGRSGTISGDRGLTIKGSGTLWVLDLDEITCNGDINLSASKIVLKDATINSSNGNIIVDNNCTLVGESAYGRCFIYAKDFIVKSGKVELSTAERDGGRYTISPGANVVLGSGMKISGGSSNDKTAISQIDPSNASDYTYVLIESAGVGGGGNDEILFGDADGDGDVTTKDVLLIRKYLGGLVDDGKINVEAADVDHDGDITTKDVLKIRKYLGGLIDELN